MKTLRYRITLLEPGLLTSLDGDPNGAVTFSFLPGSQLRGALLHKFRAGKELDPTDATAKRLFFDGATRFTNGYPLVKGQRAQPTPFTWQVPKRVKGPARNAAVATLESDKQWDSVAEPFVVLEGETAVLSKPKRQLTIHTARNRRLGRPQEQGRVRAGEDRGAIYRYEALAPHQTFEAEIICEQEADATLLDTLLEGEIVIGGARTGAYGRARLDRVTTIDASVSQSDLAVETDKLIVTLESDLVLRDAHGNYTADKEVVRDAIAARLGIEGNALKVRDAFVKTRLVGGFNRTWGLPLPQMLAIQMGSVFVFETTQANLKSDALLEKGIGERRAEGFGQVRADWGGVAEIKTAKPSSQAGVPTELDKASRALAEAMVKRMLHKRLDENVLSVANHIGMTEESLRPIRSAQLSRLRNLVHDVLMEQVLDSNRVIGYVKKAQERQTTRKQYERARVGGMRFDQWLDAILKLDAKQMNVVFDYKGVPMIGDVKAALDERMKQEYALKLIDAVLRRALALKRREES